MYLIHAALLPLIKSTRQAAKDLLQFEAISQRKTASDDRRQGSWLIKSSKTQGEAGRIRLVIKSPMTAAM